MADYLLDPKLYIKVYILITLLYCCFRLSFNDILSRLILFLLVLNFSTEVINSILKALGYAFASITTVSIIIHQGLWLYILSKFASRKRAAFFSVLFFIFFSIINVLFIEGIYAFNYYTFVLGSMLYATLFVYECFIQLRKENLFFFQSNAIIALFAPMLFLLGMSLLFAFRDYNLTSLKLFGGITLYLGVNLFVNLIYYSLLNLYIYREHKHSYKK